MPRRKQTLSMDTPEYRHSGTIWGFERQGLRRFLAHDHHDDKADGVYEFSAGQQSTLWLVSGT